MEGFLRLLMRFVGIPFKSKDRDSIGVVQRSRLEIFAMKKAMRQFDVSQDNIEIVGDEMIVTVYKETRNGTREKDIYLNLDDYTHPFHWRKDMNYSFIKAIDSVCDPIYAKLGYNTYKNERFLRDIDEWPSFGANGIYPL